MTRTLKQHSVTYTASVARQAAEELTAFLQAVWPQTVAVHNVEEDPAYQAHDIDLLWSVIEKEQLRVIPVEIKGDRYHQTGNFFLETVSNEGKGTTGCFLYTRAEWLFYYFVEIGLLYCLPMAAARPWFAANMHRFAERRTSTPVGNNRSYVTVGRLVPVKTLLAEVPGVLQFQKKGEEWEAVRGA
jgi:hypothetical protein